METMNETSDVIETPPVPPVIEVTETPMIEEPAPPPPPKAETKGKPTVVIRKPATPAQSESADIRAISIAEDASLRTMLEMLGTNGAFQVAVHRVDPEEIRDPSSGRMVKTSGLLRKYNEVIDDEAIKKRHGGGKYTIKIHRATGKGEQMVFFRQRTLEIAGDPNLDDPALSKLSPPPTVSGSAPVVPVPAESDKLATRAMEMMEKQLERSQERQAGGGEMEAMRLVIDSLNRQITNLTGQLAEANKAPATDPFRDRLLGSMLDGQNAALDRLRTQHDSEMRTLRENARADLDRAQDRHERDVATLRASFEREIASLKATYEREISTLKSHGDIVRTVQESATSSSIKVLEGQVRTLEREIAAKDKELAELRAKKDKGLLEQLTEVKKIKEALNDDDDEEQGIVSQIAGALPEVISKVGGLMGKPAAAPAAAPAVAAPAKPRMIVNPQTGQRGVQMTDGTFRAVAPPPQAANGPQLPQISKEEVDRIVGLLERAFEGNQEPEVVAQSAKGMLAGREEIFQAVRQLGGVDRFLTEVAHLPSSSPLASQAGKNWVRKFSKALVGE